MICMLSAYYGVATKRPELTGGRHTRHQFQHCSHVVTTPAPKQAGLQISNNQRQRNSQSFIVEGQCSKFLNHTSESDDCEQFMSFHHRLTQHLKLP